MSSYQKLKKEVEELKRELIVVCNYPKTPKATEIKYKWYMKYQIEKALMMGNINNSNTFNGMLPQSK